MPESPDQPSTPLQFPPLLGPVRRALHSDVPVFLVGGAVRDALLARDTHDLDFAVGGDALGLARKVADQLGGAYYTMDPEHGTGRVILTGSDQERYILDFTRFRGPDLESDLRARDFTINAIAVRVSDLKKTFDPTGGVSDLRKGLLRTCSATALQDDPLRIMRGVRLATTLSFHIVPAARSQMRAAAEQLSQVSLERVRDELFRILTGPKPEIALRALDRLGGLAYILPELEKLKTITETIDGTSTLWDHSFRTLQKLRTLLDTFGPEHDPDTAATYAQGFAVVRLGRYRAPITAHLDRELAPERSTRSILALAALYHEVGRTSGQQDSPRRIRAPLRAEDSARLATMRGRELRLSNRELKRLATIVQHHLRPQRLAQMEPGLSRRDVYRYFRETGPAGVDIVLLSLADTLATYGPALSQKVWTSSLNVARELMEAWWEHRDERVDPPPFLSGQDLLRALDLAPGPDIGKILEKLREAQACGEIQDRDGALALAGRLVDRM